MIGDLGADPVILGQGQRRLGGVSYAAREIRSTASSVHQTALAIMR